MSRKLAISLMAAIAATVVLTSCVSESDVPGHFPDISLAESKSPTQLLRNIASDRIPAAVVADIVSSSDASVACLDGDVDPEQSVRSWQSTAQVSLIDESAGQLDDLVAQLVASYEDQGWSTSALGGTGRGGSKLLFSTITPQSILVVGLPANDVRADVPGSVAVPSASIAIVVNGPCVRTAGEGSDEVAQLEG